MQFTKFQSQSKAIPTVGTLKSLLKPTDKVKLLINKKDVTKRPIVLINDSDFVIVSQALAPAVRDRKLTVQHLAFLPIIENERGFFITLPGGEPEVAMGDLEQPDMADYVAA